MPIYEYECTQCKERSEIIRQFSDPPHTHCPQVRREVKNCSPPHRPIHSRLGLVQDRLREPLLQVLPSKGRARLARREYEGANSEGATSEARGSTVRIHTVIGKEVGDQTD